MQREIKENKRKNNDGKILYSLIKGQTENMMKTLNAVTQKLHEKRKRIHHQGYTEEKYQSKLLQWEN